MGEPEGLLVARIVIERRLLDDGTDAVYSEATNGGEDRLDLLTTLGLLRMTEDTAIRESMGDTPDDDD